MSSESFHPTLVSNGYVTDEHRSYADWARMTYRSVADIPGVNDELRVGETAAGDRIRFYVNEPNPQLPDTSRDGLIVRRHPFSNGNLTHMHLWSQIIADVTGMRVVSFPNNIGKEKFEHFSRETRRRFTEKLYRPSDDPDQRFRPMAFRAIALAHAEIVEDELLGDEQVYPFGWSEGGSTAAALFAVSGDRLNIRRVGVGDPPNSINRSTIRLLQDFGSETGEKFSDAARRANIGALSEALNLDDDELRKKNGNRWIRNIVLHPPLARIAMLKGDTVYSDLEDGLKAHDDSSALAFTGEVSPIAPTEVMRNRIENINSAMGYAGITLLVLEGAGHGAADQIFDQAVIADKVTSE